MLAFEHFKPGQYCLLSYCKRPDSIDNVYHLCFFGKDLCSLNCQITQRSKAMSERLFLKMANYTTVRLFRALSSRRRVVPRKERVTERRVQRSWHQSLVRIKANHACKLNVPIYYIPSISYHQVFIFSITSLDSCSIEIDHTYTELFLCFYTTTALYLPV